MRYRWAVLAAGTAAQASFSAVLLGLPVLAPALRDELDLSLSGVGFVLGSAWVAPTVTLLAWGLAADRFGERVVLAVGLGVMAVFIAALALASGVVSLVLLLGAASAAGVSVNAASGRAVMHWFSSDERGLALGVRQSALPLGGGLSAVALPPIERAGGLDAAFLFLAALCLAAAVVGAVVLRDRAGEEVTLAAGAVPWTLHDVRLWLLSVGSCLYLVAQVSFTGFVVLFLHDERGLSVGSAAAVLAGANAAAVALRIGVGVWSDRVRTRVGPLRRLGVAIAAAAALSAGLVSGPAVLLVPSLLAACALSMSWNGLSFAASAELAGPARSGAAIGFQQTALSVAGSIVPIAFAVVVDAVSWRVGFAVAALGPLAGAVVLGRLGRL